MPIKFENVPNLAMILYMLFVLGPFVIVALIGRKWGRGWAALSIIPVAFIWFVIAQGMGVLEHGVVPGRSWPFGMIPGLIPLG